ncbi:MAG: TlyA family RNA methyltransferase [Candidatus Sulfobium sp.]|jgi:23S rRNA (cytidine1920-2'-O)/16S rRNA (cytidine1409-2'-O)-methyltransferase
MSGRERLDKVLVDRGLVKSRERAKALVMEGRVAVDGSRVLKAGTPVAADADVVLRGADIPFVSRGGLKLQAALDFFTLEPAGAVAMDIGCSTGGFTDCLLKRGVRKVYAVDVGYGQFDWALRGDRRIILFEKTNIRYLGRDAVREPIDLAVIDVSFISLLKVLPKALEFLAEHGSVLALVKPQFEVGRELVGKGGVVRDESARMSAVEKVLQGAGPMGFAVVGRFESPVPGQKGNREYFVYLKKE